MKHSYNYLKKIYLAEVDFENPVEVEEALTKIVRAYMVSDISIDDLSDLANTLWMPGRFTTKKTESLDMHLMYAAVLSYYDRQSIHSKESANIFAQSLKDIVSFAKNLNYHMFTEKKLQ